MRFAPHTDSELSFPSATIVNASAGSGKTYNLTFRLIQFLLSPVIPRNGLKNILAVTFTNNAVREMRDRVMKTVKQIALRDPRAVAEVSALLSMPEELVIARAAHMVDLLLAQYSDFQVRTIDSFLTMIFRECALEFGFQPEAQIALGDYRLVDTAFDLFLRDIERVGTGAEILQPLVDLIQFHRRSDSSFLWDPYRNLSRYVKELQ
jgi:ATP-dependent helicase/nuclease subunit A